MSADLPGSSEYALRSGWMRQWALDLEHLAILRNRLTTTEAELERTRTENVTLKSTLNIFSADAEVHKRRSATMEKELVNRQETINAQNSVLKQLQNNHDETHQKLVDRYIELRAEQDRVNLQLSNQTTAFTELQRKHEEQNSQAIRLRDEILSIIAQKNARQSEPVGQNNPELMPASASERPQESAETQQPPSGLSSTTRGTAVQPQSETVASTSRPAATREAVQPQSEPIAATCEAVRPQSEATSQPAASMSSVILKPEIKDEDDDISIIESMSLRYLTPLPEGRHKELQTFPEFVPDVDESVVFSRAFLSASLGGSHQPLIVKIGVQKSLAKERNIRKFLVPNLNQNPWCPLSPGKHGYMFVGLGNESETFREPEQLNLFLSVPPKSGHGKTLEVTYLGFYEVSRVAGLSVTEWGTLSSVVQRNYTDTTCSRQSGVTGENKHRAHAKIQAEYGSGVLSVPCVRLRCVGFDDALYAGLLAARTGNSTTLSRERDRPDSDSPSPKRRRTEKT